MSNNYGIDARMVFDVDGKSIPDKIGDLSSANYTDVASGLKDHTTQLAQKAQQIKNITTYDLSQEKQASEPDYTLALQRIAANIQLYETLLIPEGTFDITSEIVFSSKNDITIVCKGIIRTNNCSGITFQNCQRVRGNVRILNVSLNWTDEIRGITLDQSSNCSLDVTYCENFKYGLVLQALTNGGTSYTDITSAYIKNNKYNVYLHCASGGWVTENKFYGGRYTLDSSIKSSQTGNYGVYMQRDAGSTWTMDNIRFYSPCFENLHNGIHFNCTDSLLDHPRFENVDNKWAEGTLVRSMFNAGVGGVDPTKIGLDSSSIHNIFTGKFGTTDNTFTIGSNYGGLGFINTQGDNTLLGLLQHLNLLNAMKFTDSAGQVQVFNKAFEGSAIPTAGAYRKNSIVWNTNITTGQPMGWMCTAQGSMGTLSGITASGTSGSSTITVNSSTGLYVGAYILIAGVNGTKVIQNINGLTLTLSASIDATVSNAVVSFANATWKALPNHS